MSWLGQIKGQLEDLICYVLVPGLAVITPAAFSRWLLRRITRWNWVLAKAAEASLAGAGKHVNIADSAVWMRRWKRVELFDVRDLYMMSFGRSRSVLAEIQCSESIEIAKESAIALKEMMDKRSGLTKHLTNEIQVLYDIMRRCSSVMEQCRDPGSIHWFVQRTESICG